MQNYTGLIAEARKLAEKAAAGPWRDTNGYGDYILASSEKGGVFPVAQVRGYGYFHGSGSGALGLSEKDADKIMDANAAFIARSRTLVPELCDALEKALAEIDQLREERRWIPVTERLPEDDDTVPKHSEAHFEFCSVLASGYYVGSDKPSVTEVNRLINYKTGIDYIDRAAKIIDKWYWGGSFERVTHWQPLPVPPEKEGGKPGW